MVYWSTVDAFLVLLSQQAPLPTLSCKYSFTLLAHLSLPWVLDSIEITKWGFISISARAFDQISHLWKERKSRRRRPHIYCSLLLLAVLSSLPVSDPGKKKSLETSVFLKWIHRFTFPWFFRKEQIPHFHLYLVLAGLSVDVTLFIRKLRWLLNVWSCHVNIFPPVMYVKVHMNLYGEISSDKGNC